MVSAFPVREEPGDQAIRHQVPGREQHLLLPASLAAFLTPTHALSNCSVDPFISRPNSSSSGNFIPPLSSSASRPLPLPLPLSIPHTSQATASRLTSHSPTPTAATTIHADYPCRSWCHRSSARHRCQCESLGRLCLVPTLARSAGTRRRPSPIPSSEAVLPILQPRIGTRGTGINRGIHPLHRHLLPRQGNTLQAHDSAGKFKRPPPAAAKRYPSLSDSSPLHLHIRGSTLLPSPFPSLALCFLPSLIYSNIKRRNGTMAMTISDTQQSVTRKNRLHHSSPPAATITPEGLQPSPLLSHLERNAILSLPRRTLSLRRKASTSSLFGLRNRQEASPKSALASPPTSSAMSPSASSSSSSTSSSPSWRRRMSDAFSMTLARRDSTATVDSTRHFHASPLSAQLLESSPELRTGFDENERPSYELMLAQAAAAATVSPSDRRPNLRRQASDESFQCRGLSSSSSLDHYQSPLSVARKLENSFEQPSYYGLNMSQRDNCTYDETSVLHTRTSCSSFSTTLSEISAASSTSASDYALPITPSSVERPLRPKTRPPSLSLNDRECFALDEGHLVQHFDKSASSISALGIYDSYPSEFLCRPTSVTVTETADARTANVMKPNPSSVIPSPASASSLLSPHTFASGPRRVASCDGRYGFGASSLAGGSSVPARHTPRAGTPAPGSVPDVRLWVRFVGLPAEEALDSVSFKKTNTGGEMGGDIGIATAQLQQQQQQNPPVAPFEIDPLSTVAELKERLADMVLERFGLGISAKELTVSMHSILPSSSSTSMASPAFSLQPQAGGCSAADEGEEYFESLATSPTLRLGCSGASSDSGTATPNLMTAAWSSTASLPSLMGPAVSTPSGSSSATASSNGTATQNDAPTGSTASSSAPATSTTTASSTSLLTPSSVSGLSTYPRSAGGSGALLGNQLWTSRPRLMMLPLSFRPAGLLAAAAPSTIVTELGRGKASLWSEGVEDGLTIVTRIRSLAFF